MDRYEISLLPLGYAWRPLPAALPAPSYPGSSPCLSPTHSVPYLPIYLSIYLSIYMYTTGVVVSNKNIRDIEEIINCGEIEELIEQAKDEIHLIPLMAEWKPWEAPEIDESVRDREEAMYPEEKEERLAWEAEMEELRRIEEEKAANEKK
eukprot:TRINITY_DN16_c1_g2_i3.p1 TRINITY_DN16_c1_g2~~TRINITY_DN16_c1_g2_i3.p1  ORF type:complete len:158 (+),score=36.53 TRINITY_DN16_c1_g2_i3:27-476(+)